MTTAIPLTLHLLVLIGLYELAAGIADEKRERLLRVHDGIEIEALERLRRRFCELALGFRAHMPAVHETSGLVGHEAAAVGEDDLLHDVLREVRRDRETDADVSAARRIDRRVDADHATACVEQRAARVALVDGRVDLDVVVIGAADLTATRRDATWPPACLMASDPQPPGEVRADVTA